MSGWTTSKDLVAQVRKHWNSGRLLADRLDAESTLFPLKLRLRKPSSRDLTDRFEAVRDWVGELAEHARERRGYGYEIQWRTINHRTLGRNDLPATIVVPGDDDALRLIGKTRQTRQFDELSDDLLQEFPDLRGWLARRPLEALRRADEWPRLTAILRYFRRHPRPGAYLRQLDIAGVDTKFIQARRGLVGELLDQILPAEAIDASAAGARNFNRRFGLASRPVLVRFRILDPALALSGLTDISAPAAEFARLDLPVDEVFITENEINGLAFPNHPRAIVIFGLGYGLERLADIDWLARARCWYWGDIDTHGFAILNRLRHYLPAARSFLMDRATLDAHRELWGQEPDDHRFLGALDRLVEAEQTLYQTLRDDRLAQRLRLEQEHVRFAWLKDFLASIR
ncbi:MAG TPA: Wadjet anti-phage system protein JetD domain-containing protein [Wenzhouxiangella sp.]|nr:Wadjet anti-phage system protein JetD domain-containing protein [Wenzhouxiangella sp.]